MQKVGKYTFLGGLGGAIYYSIEILFRGYSHWSMYLLGGLCFLYCGLQSEGRRRELPIWKKVMHCSLFVVTGEFLTGVYVNIIMGWEVWDYTAVPFNIFGQVCLPFAIVFTFLSSLGIILGSYLNYWLYDGEKPSFWSPAVRAEKRTA